MFIYNYSSLFNGGLVVTLRSETNAAEREIIGKGHNLC